MTRDRRVEALDTLVVLAVGLVLLGGYTSLFSGTRWMVTVLAVLVPTAVAIVLVRLVAPAWATAAGVVAGALMLVWVFVPGSTVLALPTGRSIVALRDLLDRARTVIVEQAAPITPPTSVLLVVAIAFAIAFVLGDAVARQAWRIPLLGVLWTTMLVVPSVISMQAPPWWVFVGTALAWLWLWWSETTHGGLVPGGGAVLTGVGALAFALVVPLLAPRIEPTSSDLGVANSRVFGLGINPMIELGRSLRKADGRRVLTYTTDSGEGEYLKVSVLRQFDGRTWSPSTISSDLDAEGVDDLADGIETSEVSTSIRIESLRSSYLPVPYPAVEIRGLKGTWQWMSDGSTVRGSATTSTEGEDYTVISLDREPTADQLRAVRPPGDSLDAYRAVPRRVPDIVSRLAREHAGDADTDYDRMIALQDWLRGGFTYSVEAPVEEGFDGNGLDAMADFLRAKSGYCVHFASTLAVMGRLLDVPTRVAVGYAPGDDVLSRTTERATFAVSSDDLHAWTEAYFPGVGWIPFDATPGIGAATAFAEEERGDGGRGADAEVPEVSGDEAGDVLDARDRAEGPGESAERTTAWRPALLGIVVAGLLGAVPAAVRQVRRQRRWRTGARATGPLWAEVADTARDLGIEPDRAETPRRFARRLAGHGVDREALGVLLTEVERDRYATGGATGPVAEARRVVDSLQHAQRRRVRWLARVLPRSLLR